MSFVCQSEEDVQSKGGLFSPHTLGMKCLIALH